MLYWHSQAQHDDVSQADDLSTALRLAVLTLPSASRRCYCLEYSKKPPSYILFQMQIYLDRALGQIMQTSHKARISGKLGSHHKLNPKHTKSAKP